MPLWIAIMLVLAAAWPRALLARATPSPARPTQPSRAERGAEPAMAPPLELTAPKKRRRRRRSRWRSFVQLRAAPGLRLLQPSRAWGTRLTIDRLTHLASAYRAEYPEAPPVHVHDISAQAGGKLHPHLSHRHGRDVDIRLMLRVHTEKYRRASPRTLHVERTWFILKHLIDTGDVDVIFLDRRLQRAVYLHARERGHSAEELRPIFEFLGGRAAVIRHWKGHEDHIHVRFRHEPSAEPMV